MYECSARCPGLSKHLIDNWGMGAGATPRLAAFPPPILLTGKFVCVLAMRKTHSVATDVKAPRLAKAT